MSNGLTRRVASAIAVLLLVVPSPALAEDVPPSPDSLRTSSLEVEVRSGTDEPVSGAIVHVVNIDRRDEGDATCTTGSKGRCEIENLIYGMHAIAIEVGGEAYPANRTLLIPPERRAEAEFVLGGFRPTDADLGLSPGEAVELAAGRPAAGVARLQERLGPTGWAWLRTGRGATVLVGGTALAVGLIILTTDDDSDDPDLGDTSVSPATPRF